MKSFLKLSVLFCFLIGLFIAYHFNKPIQVTTEEIFRDDETEQIQRSVDNFLNIVENNKGDYIARGAHSKGHACVKAYFKVNEDIAKDLRHGILKYPDNEYKSWIRFSNGASRVKGNYDYNKDARGMAVKLVNIFEQGIMQKANAPEYQDFLMHDSPVFFTANMEDYNQFTESSNKVLYFISDPNPFNWKLRGLKHGLATLKHPPESLLDNQYFSNTAYKLGPHNIKFTAKSCNGSLNRIKADQMDKHFLRNEMSEKLENSDACFNFMIQKQDPNKRMPIEDPSVLWDENDSPFISVAKIIIPKQIFDTPEQQRFCENLSFSPWNALPEHRPIGELNRIRKAVYKASSDYRHQKNATEVPTNLIW